MIRCTPSPSYPHARLPPGLSRHVVVRSAGLAPEHDLAKLQALLPALLAKQPLVRRLAVQAHQVLRDHVPHELHEPRDDGVVDRYVGVDLAFQRQEVHPEEPLEDLDPVLNPPLDSCSCATGWAENPP